MTKNSSKKPPAWLIDKLPAYDSAHYLPQRFEDSTHDLWQLKSTDAIAGSSNLFLKVCNNTTSPFWQIMEHLFAFNLSAEIDNFDKLYAHIDEVSPLTIPQLIKAETHQFSADKQHAFILSSELSGAVMDGEDIGAPMVDQLAGHLVALHKQAHAGFGVINRQPLPADDWPQRLHQTLQISAQPRRSRDNVGAKRRRPEGRDKVESKWGGVSKQNDKYLKQALAACETIQTDEFIPMMPDLRWDQFLALDGKLHALVDLDAFVLAPRELDFVLLEYILSAEHFNRFIDVYSAHHSIPEINHVRPAYRLLLFYMQILGEVDMNIWMNAPKRF